jgi:flagellar export protein FliJ
LVNCIAAWRPGGRNRSASFAAGLSLAAFLEASRERVRAAHAELRHLAAEREAQAARLLERRLELKRLELLIARQRRRREAEARRREQGAADELALLRAARRTAR